VAKEGYISEEYSKDLNVMPTEFTVSNYPNPFNPVTTIRFNLPESGNVMAKIYNIRGKEINELVNGVYNAGVYNIQWDAKDQMGRKVSSGLYIIRVQYNNRVKTQKMILMK
jgi:flagellar hook assembly protein FlgD